MAPISLPDLPSGESLHLAARSLASHLLPRALSSASSPPPAAPRPLALLSERQTQILAIPTTYGGLNAGPAPGAVVGIIVGSVCGFLLALWLLYTCVNLGGGPALLPGLWLGGGGRRETVIEEEIVHRHSRSRSRSRSHTETSEAPPRRSGSRRETIVVEERTTRRPSGEEVREDDFVEVIEEHSPPRRTSRRESKRVSGYRTVDPAEFGGGDRPMRKVSRRN